MATTPQAQPFEAGQLPVIRIAPSNSWVALRLGEIWQFRELLFFFVWRDIKVRYKQTTLGVAWAVLQPLFSMVVFSVLFGKVAKMPSDSLPYPLFSFSALVPWSFFQAGLVQSSNCLVESANLLKKVYFPRLALPIASVLAGLVDFTLAFLILLVMMFSYGVSPTANVVWLPLFLLLALVSALGMGLWISALNVRYRDFRYIVPFLAQMWFYITPVVIPSSLVPEKYRPWVGLNPMAGVVEGFRWALLGGDQTPAPGPVIIVSSLAAIALLIGGAFYFRRMEKTFADLV